MVEELARQALLEAPPDPTLSGLLDSVKRRFGTDIEAIVLYGSYMRGASEAMPDLYVLLARYPASPRLDRWLGRLLPPNVYVVATDGLRAKVSVLRTHQLLSAVSTDVHPYFWARFAQPCRLLYWRDEEVRGRLEYIAGVSVRRLLAAMGSSTALNDPAAYWAAVFQRTYAAELRSERSTKYLEIYEANAAYFDAVFQHRTAGDGRSAIWWLRQAIGKWLSAARLLKSALTFEDPVGYMLWKVERHSGVRLTATERQRRYPFLFAWPLIWRLYRDGAFR